VIVRAPGYVEQQVSVDAVEGQVKAVELTLERALTPVRVVATPSAGAKVRLDDEAWEPLPLSRALPEGKVRITIEAPGFLRVERTLMIEPNAPLTLELALEPDPHARAQLALRSDPAGARVVLDGKPAGLTPQSLMNLEPGKHQLHFELAEHLPADVQVALVAGKVTPVRATLVAKRTLKLRRALRWAGYVSGAALLLAGGATGIAARVERDHFYDEPSRGRYDRVDRMNIAADVLMGTGAVLGIATLVWHLVSKDPSSHGDFGER